MTHPRDARRAFPPQGGHACGLAKPVPRHALGWLPLRARFAVLRLFHSITGTVVPLKSI